jgi:hypothetical protein
MICRDWIAKRCEGDELEMDNGASHSFIELEYGLSILTVYASESSDFSLGLQTHSRARLA